MATTNVLEQQRQPVNSATIVASLARWEMIGVLNAKSLEIWMDFSNAPVPKDILSTTKNASTRTVHWLIRTARIATSSCKTLEKWFASSVSPPECSIQRRSVYAKWVSMKWVEFVSLVEKAARFVQMLAPAMPVPSTQSMIWMELVHVLKALT